MGRSFGGGVGGSLHRELGRSKRRFAVGSRIVLIVVFVVLFFTSLMVGVADVSLKGVFSFDAKTWHYLWYSRFPRTMAVTLTAAALSVGGLIMQTIGRNKLISAHTIGTVSAARLGVLFTFIFGAAFSTQVLRISVSFVFAMVFTLFFMFVLNKLKFRNAIYVPLLGMMFGAVVDGVAVFIAEATGLTQELQTIGQGNFTLMSAGRFEYLFILLIPLAVGIVCSSAFNIVGMGEDFAKNMGVNYKLFNLLGVITVAVISAITFVVVGSLPFLGLIVPNIATQIYGDNIKRSMWEIMLFGASFLLLCDIVARLVIFPFEISVSMIVGIVGGVLFLAILFSRVKSKK